MDDNVIIYWYYFLRWMNVVCWGVIFWGLFFLVIDEVYEIFVILCIMYLEIDIFDIF